jgi:hypothetical protein
MLNYFNYYTEIEDAFVRRRGKHLFLSPMDWALMETWKEQGIPLHIVLRGVERSFDSWEAKPRKRSVKSLLYCQEEVEAQFAEWLEARVGSAASSSEETREVENDAAKMPFSFAAVREHLKRCRSSLAEAADTRRRQASEDDLSEGLARAAALLEEIENDFVSSSTFDARKLEDSLTGLERILNHSIFSVASSSDLEAIKAEVKAQLSPYRSQMESAVYDQTLNNLLLKRLREYFAIPRLSLFYL